MSEVMNVPDGWEVKKLKEIGSCKNGLTYSPDDIVDSGGLLVLRSSNIQENKLAFSDNVFVRMDMKVSYKVQNKDILICVRNGSKNLIGKNTLITKEVENMAHGAFMTVFNSTINDYVFQLFQSDMYYRQVEKNLGATINSINNSDLLLFEFPFPKEKKEQQKIAKILSTLDKTIEATQKLIDKEKNIKKGLMHDLLTNGIDSNGKIRTPQTHIYKQSELGLIPEEWEVKSLDKCFKLKSGDTKPIDTSNHGNYKVYGGNGITGYSDLNNNNTEETLIIGRVGEYCGAVYLVNECWITDNALFIEKFLSKFEMNYMFYLLYFLNLNQYKAETGQPLLNQTIIGNIKICFPKIDEQRQIAKILTTQDKKIQIEETNLAKLKELKKGLMNDLLSGHVRVKL